MKKLFFVFLLSLLLIINNTVRATDTTSPIINFTIPTQNATGMVKDTEITVSFSEAIDPATVTTANFYLKQGTTDIPGSVTLDSTGKLAFLVPSYTLSASTVYKFYLTAGVKDLAGNPLAAFNRQFTTGTELGLICSQFTGYSVTDSWAYTAKVTANAQTYEILTVTNATGYKWADPTFYGYGYANKNKCNLHALVPDRIILDITHDQYLDTFDPIHPFAPSQYDTGTNHDPYVFMTNIVNQAVITLHSKYPSATTIILQPNVGGPGSTICPVGATGTNRVRGSVNHAFILQAIANVLANPPNGISVAMGYDSQVISCDQYLDLIGHLTSSGAADVGARIGAYYGQ